MRLIHLARASTARPIERSGIRGQRTVLGDDQGHRIELARGVFAMPVLPNFAITHQWVRELRRSHRERIVVVTFRVPDAEPVHVGRYSGPHRSMTATEAAAWVTNEPNGAEIVVPRSIAAKEILHVRGVTQLVGWTDVPEPERKIDCVCVACLPSGTPDFMKRIRGAMAVALDMLRDARTEDEIREALRRVDGPAERGGSRLDPSRILGYVRHENARVRESALAALGYFSANQTRDTIAPCIFDEAREVGEAAVHALVCVQGVRNTAAMIADDAPEHVLMALLEQIEWGRREPRNLAILDRFFAHDSTTIREEARAIRERVAAKRD